jgi:hypothetical protein
MAVTPAKAVRLLLALIAGVFLYAHLIASVEAEDLSPSEAQKIASEAYLYAYPMLYNYKTLFRQVMDPSFPGYVGGFNRFRHYRRGFTPADTDIVTSNNDTPYSWAWLDLRAEPMVVSVPASLDRYYVLQWFDLYAHNFAYIRSRVTGSEAGDYLLAGPTWQGATPSGVKNVLRSETEIVGTLTRTAWTGPDDIEGLVAMQRQYRIRPLSEYLGVKPPEPAPILQFPAWDETRAKSIGFINYLNFALRFAPTVPSQQDMMKRFALIGIGAGPRLTPHSSIRPSARRSRLASRTHKNRFRPRPIRRRVPLACLEPASFLATTISCGAPSALRWASTATPRRKRNMADTESTLTAAH